jgi:hypothetical protein
MLVSVLPVPFGDAGRQRQYEAVLATLQAEAESDAPATVLLGNLGAFSALAVDMLIVRPQALALVVLVPQAGQLTIPALAHGTWQLDGRPLLDFEEVINPFAQYQQQLPLALAWLSEEVGLPTEELPPCAGIALFEAPLTFGPEVEAHLHRHAAAHDFQLVGDAAQLPARLHQAPSPDPAALDADELLGWGEYLATEPYAPPGTGRAESLAEGLATILGHKLRQLWRWLGADDIPADPPYGGSLPDQQDQAHLQQLRQELQAGLHQQRQEAAARETLRTQELALLRQQLAQNGPSATQREAALEESLRTARAELATRNHELDARIQQLGQLIKQLQATPAASVAAPRAVAPASAPKLRSAKAPAWSFRRLRQAERWGLVLLAVASVGVGTWSAVRWAQHPKRPTATASRKVLADNNSEENQPTEGDAPDSLARAQAETVDTLTTPTPESILTTTEPTPTATEPAPTTTENKVITSEDPAPEATPAATETTAPAAPVPTADPSSARPDPAPAEPSPTP